MHGCFMFYVVSACLFSQVLYIVSAFELLEEKTLYKSELLLYYHYVGLVNLTDGRLSDASGLAADL